MNFKSINSTDSRTSVRAFRSLVCPYLGPEFEPRCRLLVNVQSSVGFLEALLFPEFHPINTLHFSIPLAELHFIFSFFHSFHVILHLVDCQGKFVWFGASSHTSCWRTKQVALYVLLHWNLSVSEHRPEQNGWRVTDHYSSVQGLA